MSARLVTAVAAFGMCVGLVMILPAVVSSRRGRLLRWGVVVLVVSFVVGALGGLVLVSGEGWWRG